MRDPTISADAVELTLKAIYCIRDTSYMIDILPNQLCACTRTHRYRAAWQQTMPVSIWRAASGKCPRTRHSNMHPTQHGALITLEVRELQVSLPRKLNFFFFQAEDGIRDLTVTGVQTCALPI